MIDADALYYTFSTIPQVLAGMIALLGVFWVFKISEIKKRLMYIAEVIKREIDTKDAAKRPYIEKLNNALKENYGFTQFDCRRISYRISSSYEQEDYKSIYDMICTIEKAVPNEIVTKMKESFEKFDQEKSILTSNSKLALTTCGIDIALSLCILMIVPWLADSPYLAYTVMIPNLIFFIFNIIFVIRTIIVTLKVEKYVA